ncbi:MAG: biosynthetic-type acetolactate synthase large subunit [Longimicrobiales bacterium]|nr:biosynthetic-type acetolactate synthase large subunit [Longimicrobiales bacterium]
MQHPQMQSPTAADMVWRTLEEEGVRVVFGHPGGAILPVYDALHRHGGIRHVLVRHEQAAAHAADGYARVTGRPGVCLATSGPGATNLITGLATAQMDSVPLLAITGQVPLDAMGTQAFQETDIVSVARPVTKGAWLIDDPDDIRPVLREALRVAREGRPGPVLVDIPKCVQESPCGDRNGNARPEASRPAPGDPAHSALDPDPGDAPPTASSRGVLPALDGAAELLTTASRPVLMVGRGVILSGMCDEVIELARRLDLPVATTLLGLDAFPARDPRALGMAGMHGTERANRAIDASDLIVGLGLRFDDRIVGDPERFAPGATVVHFDVDPDAPRRTVEASVAVVGDLRETLPALFARLGIRRPGREPGPGYRHGEWWRRIREWSRECASVNGSNPAGPGLSGREAARAVCRRIETENGILVTDVGQHQMWMAQELRGAAPRTHLTSGGLGTMGYALPAAIGAAVGSPAECSGGSPAESLGGGLGESSSRPVWVVAGDGGFQMTLQELATVRDEGPPLRIVVMNNGFLGMVRQWQELFYERRYAATRLTGPDFVRLAAAYGIPGWVASTREELDEALDRARSESGPLVLDVRIQEEENVYPMVPTGASLGEMVLGPAVRSPRVGALESW